MAAVLRTGLVNLSPKALLGGLCKVTPKHGNVVVTQVSFISGRELRKDRPPKPKPFDWRNKEYNRWAYMKDPIEARMDENSKIVIVEGLPGVGKDKFAKQLAEELEMIYVRPPNFDTFYVNAYGFDYRSLNPKLPENAQFFDFKSFLEKPNGVSSAAMQLAAFQLRCHQYIDGLCDLFASGQGVVLQRSPWSDPIFMEAMFKSQYVTRGGLTYYKTGVGGVLPELMKPHLVLYLDAPISVIKDNIKKRNIPYEVNSKALTDKYLQDLDQLYKEYLRGVTKHSHLLIYDWSREGDMSVVVEDIERLDFDSEKNDSEKFFEWRYEHISTLKVRRGEYAMYRDDIMAPVDLVNFDVPEMFITAEENLLIDTLLCDIPEAKYAPGFNPQVDKGILTKLNSKYEESRPRGKVEKV